MNARSWRLLGKNLSFGVEEMLPTRVHDVALCDFMRQFQEHFVMSQFRRIERVEKICEFLIFRSGSEHCEAFA